MSKRQLAPNKVEWPIKRDTSKLNKCIYKLTSKLLTCTTKLELIPLSKRDSDPHPKLMVQLRPYGSEEDGNKFVTAKAMIELNFPKGVDCIASKEWSIRSVLMRILMVFRIWSLEWIIKKSMGEDHTELFLCEEVH